MRRLIGKFIFWCTAGVHDHACEKAIGQDTNGVNPFGPVAKNSDEHKIAVAIQKAMNGTVLEIGVFKPNPRGPDWTYSQYVCDPDKTLAENIAMAMHMKGLENS